MDYTRDINLAKAQYHDADAIRISNLIDEELKVRQRSRTCCFSVFTWLRRGRKRQLGEKKLGGGR